MTLNNKNRPGLIWLVIILILFGIGVVGYLLLQPNSDKNNSDYAIEQEISTQKQENMSGGESEIKNEIEVTGTTITSKDSEFGSILFDGDNQAIYIWELEKSATAECYGDCALAWPPVLTDGLPIASGNVSNELLGTTERNDGTTQVTYNNHPLYYYAHESADEVKCHNISTHGGLWWVIKPDGVRAD